jgi:hypothetical protein
MRTTDEGGNLYPMYEFSSPEFARLQAAVADRAPNLRLHRTRLNGAQLVIAVMVPGATATDPWSIGSYITRARLPSDLHPGCWHIHHPERGPQMELNTAQQVAKFLSFDPSFSAGWSDRWNQWMLARGELFASE